MVSQCFGPWYTLRQMTEPPFKSLCPTTKIVAVLAIIDTEGVLKLTEFAVKTCSARPKPVKGEIFQLRGPVLPFPGKTVKP